MSPKTKEFYKARGCIIKQSWIQIPFECPHLKNGKCDIYDNRPANCKDYFCWTAKSPFKLRGRR